MLMELMASATIVSSIVLINIDVVNAKRAMIVVWLGGKDVVRAMIVVVVIVEIRSERW